MINEYQQLLDDCERELNNSGQGAINRICELLHNRIAYYNWVGFYLMDEASRELVLGPFAGAPTEHTRIPYGRGICGQVAESGKPFVVQNVDEQDNYLACSLETRAEIVVPVYHKERLIGQIDIDSHSSAPFTRDDEAFLNALCEKVAPYL